ncbi:hypothetical protein GGI25_002041 [Coemansia spiralis]|uniref:HPP transmembrane region domain-containing protein n=2 Tax=Coemansia TaxID=4863 RepID=A0A9W8KXW4_9FUNG|nr:hypothetical protein EDC05_002652 [Coemansia umbellata]KAJ2623297.1 hypothetical protein GGI26_002525 [Coemansia sp. RSA 1358]KAJ2678848.1 hypothetical protein GGI25_002041 [Coemansia spiralis]
MHFIIKRLWQWIKSLPGKPGGRKIWFPSSAGDYFVRMRGAQHYKREVGPPPPVLIWAFYSGFTSFIAIAVLGIIQRYGAAIKDHHLPFAIAPTGASAVLIFGVPSSPLAQPRNVIIGHMISALIGTFMHELFKHASNSFLWMPGALAVGISIGLMGLTNCYHPPAGATAFIAGYSLPDIQSVGWWFPLYPVLPIVIIMVCIGIILNNFSHVYPVYWFTPVHLSHPIANIPSAPTRSTEAKSTEIEDEEEKPHSEISPSTPNTSSSSSSSEYDNVQEKVIEQTTNDGDAERAWMQVRISELEKELNTLRQKYEKKTHYSGQ